MTGRWVGVVAGAVMLTAHAWAQGTTLEADLQRAVQKMAVSGDCQAAVPELRAIAQRAGATNKSVAAEAQHRIDQCLGRQPDSKPAGPFRALDVDTRVSIDGVMSPDGTRVIEQDPRGLVVRELATGRPRVVFATHDQPGGELTYRVATPVWSSDGKAIAFFAQDRRIKNDIGNAIPPSYALRAVNADGSESREICKLPAAPPVMSILEWTARNEILYRIGMRVGPRGGGGLTPGVGAEFWLVAATGGEPRKSFTMPTESAAEVGNTPPDGRHIIVVRSEKLVEIDLASGGARDLSLGIGAAYPRVSPDGKLIAYLSRQDGAWAAYVSPLDSATIRGAVRIADIPARREEPPSLGAAQGFRWHPNGVLTLDYQDSETNLYRIDLDASSGRASGGPQRLTRDLDAMEPVISPDGKRVLFVLPVSRQSPRSAVFVMPADGGKPRQLVALPAAQQVSRQIGGSFGWLSNDEMFVAGQGPAIQSVNVTSGVATAAPNSSPLGGSVLFAPSPTEVGRVQVAGTPARVGRRFQYIPTRNAILFEAIDQYGIPDLVLRDLANGQDRIVWRREPTVPAAPAQWQVSPDGRLLAYWGVPFGMTFEAGKEPAIKDTPNALNIVTLDGGPSRIHLRTVGPNGSALAWAADSRHILCLMDSSTVESSSPRILDIDTGTSQLLFDEPLGTSLGIKDGWTGRWAWSPDNKFLVFDASGQATHRYRWSGVTYDAAKKLGVKGGRP